MGLNLSCITKTCETGEVAPEKKLGITQTSDTLVDLSKLIKIIEEKPEVYLNKSIILQKMYRGRKSRKEFQSQTELMRNILTLDSTSTDMNEKKQIILNNPGEKLSMKLEEENKLTKHKFDEIPPSKYIIKIPLSYLDRSKNNDLYAGTITLDKNKIGYGICYSNGSKYEGTWVKNKLEGFSRIFLKSGDFFEGMLKQGKAEGFGRFVHSDGNSFEGEWKDDKPEGKGIEKYIDGSIFEGTFSDGQKIKGKLSWPDGSYYDGEIQEDLFEGEGIFHWVEGREYNGHWHNGKMDGQGKMNYKDGSVYEGEFKNGKRNGVGKYVWNENKTYEGGWLEGKQHGYGVYKKNDQVLQGNWVNGKLVNENAPSTSVSINDTFSTIQSKYGNEAKNNLNKKFNFRRTKSNKKSGSSFGSKDIIKKK